MSQRKYVCRDGTIILSKRQKNWSIATYVRFYILIPLLFITTVLNLPPESYQSSFVKDNKSSFQEQYGYLNYFRNCDRPWTFAFALARATCKTGTHNEVHYGLAGVWVRAINQRDDSTKIALTGNDKIGVVLDYNDILKFMDGYLFERKRNERFVTFAAACLYLQIVYSCVMTAMGREFLDRQLFVIIKGSSNGYSEMRQWWKFATCSVRSGSLLVLIFDLIVIDRLIAEMRSKVTVEELCICAVAGEYVLMVSATSCGNSDFA